MFFKCVMDPNTKLFLSLLLVAVINFLLGYFRGRDDGR